MLPAFWQDGMLEYYLVPQSQRAMLQRGTWLTQWCCTGFEAWLEYVCEKENRNRLKLMNYSAAQNAHFLSTASIIVPLEPRVKMERHFILSLSPWFGSNSTEDFTDWHPALPFRHTHRRITDASFLTASVKFHLQKSLGTIKQKPNGKQGTITELVIAMQFHGFMHGGNH